MERLADDVIEAAVTGRGWERRQDKLVLVVEREDFAQAMVVVNAVAQLAEATNHHPDISIHWNTVELSLWTHTAGGITQADLDMAAAIDGLLP